MLCQVGTFGVNLVKMMSRWTSIFYGVSFSEETHLVLEYGDNFKGEMTSTFQYTGSSKIKSIKIVGDSKLTGVMMNNTFNNCSVKTIDFSECDLVLSTAAMQNTFSYCPSLTEIKGTLDVSKISSFVGVFNGCNVLEEVRFLEENIFKTITFGSCKLLSDASIQSIINGLAKVEEAQTITFHVDVKAKLTEDQIAQITSKNWTLS